MVKTGTKMLKKVYDDSGETDTNAIAKELGIKNNAVDSIGLKLVSRGLLRKRVEVKKCPTCPGLVRKKTIWSIREQKRQKIIDMLNEDYGGNFA